MRRVLIIILIAALAANIFAPVAGAIDLRGTEEADLSHVRVQLVSLGTDLVQADVTLTGVYTLAGTGIELSNGTLKVSLTGEKLSLCAPDSSLIYSASELTLRRSSVKPEAGNIALTNGRKYLGDFTFKVASDNGKKYISVINTVPTIYYLYGVLAAEMGNDAPQEALKAQSLSAKSYVLSRKDNSDEYDVGDTSKTQVYKGYDPAWNNIIKAVDSTANEVVLYDGEIMYTLYASSNGGETDIPSHAWGTGCTHLNPGYEVTIDDYDFNSTGARETLEITLGAPCDNANLSSMLMHYAQEDGAEEIVTIDKCELNTPRYDGVKRNMTNAHFEITAKCGGDNKKLTLDVPVSDFMTYKVFSNSSLKTYWGESVSGGKYAVYHARNGHGVGLSQRAAKYRALLGQDYRDILSFYFPGSTIGIRASISDSLTDQGSSLTSSPAATGKFAKSIDKLTGGTGITVYNSKNTATASSVTQKPASVSAVTTVYGYAYTTVAGAYMYSAASSSSTVINRLRYGDMFLVLQIQDTWLKITLPNGMTGYVQSSDVTFIMRADTSVNYKLGYVAYDSVNFRAEPTTSSTSYGRFDKNTQLYIWGTAGEGDSWYFVQYGLTYGYVFASYVGITGTYTAQEPAENSVIASGVTKSNVYLRPQPSTNNNPIKTLSGGTYMLIYSLSNGWYRVFAGGEYGYVSESYVTINTAIPVAPAGVPTVPVDVQPIGIGTVNATNVRFRSTPDTSVSNNIITLLQRGDRLTLFSLENGWYYASFEGQRGYVSAEYVDVSPLSPPEVTDGALYLTQGVTTGNINFREGAGTDYAVYRTLAKGTELEIIGKYDTWYFVRVEGICGFVTAQYVSITKEGNIDVLSVSQEWRSYITKTTDEVNFRLGPSTAYSIIEKLPKNTTVTVLAIKGEWCLADYNGVLGFISHDYLAK